MDIDIRAVDPQDEAALAARHAVSAAAIGQDLPDFPPLCPVRYAGQLRFQGKADASLSWIGYLGGQPAGVLDLLLPLLDNTGNAEIELRVAPESRRRGLGRALYAAAVERAREHGRVRLIGQTVGTLPGGVARDPAGSEFAAAMGAKLALEEVRRRLDLSAVDVSAPTIPEAPGYSPVFWRDMPPEEYLVDIARLDSRLFADAPSGDLVIESPEPDPGRIRDWIESRRAHGIRAYHGAVRHDATGTLVAWTTLAFEPTVPDHAWQWATVVDPDHRGRRLGLRVKLSNLRRVLDREPALRVIDTWNAAVNAHMIAVNEAMGFRPVDGWNQWQYEFG